MPTSSDTTQVGKTIEVPQELQVVLERLAEADARVNGDPRREECRGTRTRRFARARKS